MVGEAFLNELVGHWDYEDSATVLGLEYVSRASDVVGGTVRVAWRDEVSVIVAVVCSLIVPWNPRIRRSVWVVCVVTWSRRVHATVRRAVLVVLRATDCRRLCVRNCNRLRGSLLRNLGHAGHCLHLSICNGLIVSDHLLLRYCGCMRIEGRVSGEAQRENRYKR